MEGIPILKESLTRYKNYFMPHFEGILGKTDLWLKMWV